VRASHRDPGQDHQGLDARADIEARNSTHQIKKMNTNQLRTLRDRLYLNEEIPTRPRGGERRISPRTDSIGT